MKSEGKRREKIIKQGRAYTASDRKDGVVARGGFRQLAGVSKLSIDQRILGCPNKPHHCLPKVLGSIGALWPIMAFFTFNVSGDIEDLCQINTVGPDMLELIDSRDNDRSS